MTEANKRQVGGNHYKKHVLEHWDLVALYGWDYFQARSIAYIMRWRDKGGIADLEKARHFIDKCIEIEKLRAIGELTETILLDALKKFNDQEKEAEEDDEEIAIEYNVSGDDPLTLEGRPKKRRMRCKQCVYDREENVCKYCRHPRLGITPAAGAPNASG